MKMLMTLDDICRHTKLSKEKLYELMPLEMIKDPQNIVITTKQMVSLCSSCSISDNQ